MEEIVHRSVLVSEVLTLLKPGKAGSIFIDATLGEGGHAEVLLENFPDLTLCGVERDTEIMQIAVQRLARFGSRFKAFNVWFTDFFSGYHSLVAQRPDRILFDLGISMYHFKKSRMGFSFNADEPLDMRIDKNQQTSARDIVNTYSEAELAEIFKDYGEERFAGRIAKRITEERRKKAVHTARELAELIMAVFPAQYRHKLKIHPATRCFQALRIAVNDELENLKKGISAAFAVLNPQGRLGVIAYHSLEDREVKHFFQAKNRDCTCPPEWPVCRCSGKRELDIVTRKPVYPGQEEIYYNRAARSARLRVALKL